MLRQAVPESEWMLLAIQQLIVFCCLRMFDSNISEALIYRFSKFTTAAAYVEFALPILNVSTAKTPTRALIRTLPIRLCTVTVVIYGSRRKRLTSLRGISNLS